MRIVVNMPAGNIGRLVVDTLLDANHDVVVISRHPEKVASATLRGAKLVEGSIDDRSTVDRAMKAADAVFWLTPIAFDRPDYARWAKQTGALAADAARRHSVRHAVVISTVGAQQGSKSELLECLWAVEQTFAASVSNVTVLRPGAFMENLLNNVGTIAGPGMIFGRYPTSKKIPMVATRDVAQRAVESLLQPGKGFRLLELHGPEDLDQGQVSRIVSGAIGRAVTYIEVPAEQARQGMLSAGMPGFFVDLMLDMYEELRAGRMEREQPRTAATTTRTTLDEFVRVVLKPAIVAETARFGSVNAEAASA